MDYPTIIGLVVGFGGILGGQALEGGHIGSVMQAAAAVIVFGGTIGAGLVAFPSNVIKKSLSLAKNAFIHIDPNYPVIISSLVELAGVARRDGVLALEQRLNDIEDPFIKKAIGFVVDGVDANVTRDSLEAEIFKNFEEEVNGGKFWETMGAFSPTIGIIGAVLGLIHVMENLSDPSKLGSGIAVAFVATVYGVGIANLILLPMGKKIIIKAGEEKDRKTVIAEGVLSIQEGLNPRVLEEKLKSYVGGHLDSEESE
jgi:chemotaxis protein MotA